MNCVEGARSRSCVAVTYVHDPFEYRGQKVHITHADMHADTRAHSSTHKRTGEEAHTIRSPFPCLRMRTCALSHTRIHMHAHAHTHTHTPAALAARAALAECCGCDATCLCPLCSGKRHPSAPHALRIRVHTASQEMRTAPQAIQCSRAGEHAEHLGSTVLLAHTGISGCLSDAGQTVCLTANQRQSSLCACLSLNLVRNQEDPYMCERVATKSGTALDDCLGRTTHEGACTSPLTSTEVLTFAHKSDI